MTKKVKIGDVIWAKVKGYPWWPGVVSKSRNKERLQKLSKKSTDKTF